MGLYCCGCRRDVRARLTTGEEIYPHRSDLHSLPFWKCDRCGNHVGCHHKTKNRTAPLGCIPTPELKNARKHIHAILDPIWQSGLVNRKEVYAAISKKVGRKYHTAEIRSIEEARKVYKIVRDYANSLQRNPKRRTTTTAKRGVAKVVSRHSAAAAVGGRKGS